MKTWLFLGKRLRKYWRMAVVSMLLLLMGGLGLLYCQVDARAKNNAPRAADVIIVLGSAVWQGERPSPSLYARTQQGIALYRTGYAPHLIFSGGLGRNPPTEAEVMRRLATNAGVPTEAMVLEDQSHSTEENLANSKRLMDARGWRTAIIVSDPFHLLRAEMIARDLGMDATGSGAQTSPTYTATAMRVWYTAREALAIVWYAVTRVTGEPTWLYTVLKTYQQTNN